MYFFANNYFDGLATLFQNSYSTFLTATGKKELELKHDLMFLNSFFSNYSKVDQRKFARTSKTFSELEAKVNLFKGSNPIKYYEILDKYPAAPTIIDMYKKHKGELNKITKEIKNLKRDSTINRKMKVHLLKTLEEYQVLIKRQMIHMVDQEITNGLLKD